MRTNFERLKWSGWLDNPIQQNRFAATQSIPDDIRSTLSSINSVINLLQSKLPMTSYIQAFLAVARHENESVDYYAKICGCSSGAMSERLSELGELSSRDRKAGYGLLENPIQPDGSPTAYDQVVGEGARVGGADCRDGGDRNIREWHINA